MARTAPVPNIPPIPGMCPSILVAAGGSDSGGSGGKGAGGGGAGGPGTGGGAADGTGGDGKAGGTCSGSAPPCTNCGHGGKAGDPVDALTGEVFTEPKTDVLLPGPINFKLDRSYSSFSRKYDEGFGWGWTHSFAWRGEIKRDEILIHSGANEIISFAKLEPGEYASFQGWALLRVRDHYVLRAGDEFFHELAPSPGDPDVLLLDSIRYRNLGSIDFSYNERNQLVEIQDTAGRRIKLARGSDGRVSSISVPDPNGTNLVFARYRYDPAGNLVEAVDADGHAWAYAYDDDRRLIHMSVPGGPTFHYLYDREGRCVETWGDLPDGADDPALDPSIGKLLADGKTKARGIYHAKIEFGQDGYSEVVDSVQVQRFFASESQEVTKGINGRGAVTTREYDDLGRMVSECDANMATWKYKYDYMGNVTESTDPEGRVVQVEYDREGRPLRLIDPIGGEVQFSLDVEGNVVSETDQKGATTLFSYDARGLLVGMVEADGAKRRFAYDGHANLVAVEYPNGAIQRFEYDYWGRLTATQLPDGRRFDYRYSASGNLVQVTDNLGRTKRYEYDALLNVAAEILPDGSVHRRQFGGLGWVSAVIAPDGSTTRYFYNREGWQTLIINEKGERYEMTYNASGTVSHERTFAGVERRFVRDLRDRVVAIEEPGGKSVIEHNKVGQVVKVTGRKGQEQEFVYDERGLLKKAIAPNATFEWDYDATGEIVRETFHVGTSHYVVESERDIMGRRIAVRTNLGHVAEQRRNAMGDVAELWSHGEQVVRVTRDPMGWPLRRDLPGGGAIVDELDGATRLRKRVVVGPESARPKTFGEPDWVGALPLAAIDKTYQYTMVDELASVTTAADGTTEYTYDLRRNLVSRRGRATSEDFQYDAAGNPHETGPLAPGRAYQTGSKLVRRGHTEYAYDASGRIEEKSTLRDDGTKVTTRYRYDDWDLLQAVDLPDGRTVEFTYDAFARLVQRRVYRRTGARKRELVSSIDYVWDLVSVIHQIENVPGASSKVDTFLYENNDALVPWAMRHDAAGGAENWVHFVHEMNGAPEELVDGQGSVLGRATHSAYGVWDWSAESRETTAFRYPGQIADADTGLHYNRYRPYDPETGRYLTPDPIGLNGGTNFYAYGPNPVGWFDPMGESTTHTTKVETDGDFHGKHQNADGSYQSGSKTKCPKVLKSEAKSHSEQKFAHDLIKQGTHQSGPKKGQSNGEFEGQKFKLTGSLPPCTNCHRAMQNAADKTGATIKYKWKGANGKMQSITYKPNKAPKAKGKEGKALNKAYKMSKDADAPYGYKFENNQAVGKTKKELAKDPNHEKTAQGQYSKQNQAVKKRLEEEKKKESDG